MKIFYDIWTILLALLVFLTVFLCILSLFATTITGLLIVILITLKAIGWTSWGWAAIVAPFAISAFTLFVTGIPTIWMFVHNE